MNTSAGGADARPTHEDHADAAAPAVALRTAAQAEAMVIATVQGHANDLLRVARRYSLCADDAHEAYQRALEIYVRHARRLEAETAHRWLFTVLKHEALAVRRQRSQLLGADESELDRLESRTTDSPEDRAIAADDVSRAAAALRRLKPDEIRALWLKASGLSYAEIMEQEGWSYTKVNRCLAEGRASLARHRTAIDSGAECERYLPMLSRLLDGEASRKELRPLRVHLKTCAGCRAELRSLHERGDALRLVLPSGVLAGSAATNAADVPNLLTRLYETVATTIHDRAALSAIKLQAAVEAASTGKLAAVAASAAAVAGGGAVAATEPADSVVRPHRAAQERPGAPASMPMATQTATTTAAPASLPARIPSVPATDRPSRGPQKAAPQARRDKRRLHSIDREFEPTPSNRTASPSSAQSSGAVAATDEFQSEVPATAAAGAAEPTPPVGTDTQRTSSVSAATREFAP